MPHITHRSRLRLCIFILTVLFALTACIGGGDSGTSGPGTVVEIADGGATISGSVIDGPVIAATIMIKDAQGETVATTTSDGNARFTAHIPDQATFPLTITSTGGFNIVTNGPPTFALASTVMKPSDTTANLNPFSTLIVRDRRQAMPGGLTPANLSAASGVGHGRFQRRTRSFSRAVSRSRPRLQHTMSRRSSDRARSSPKSSGATIRCSLPPIWGSAKMP